MSRLTKYHFRLLLLIFICSSVMNIGFTQQIDPETRMSNHFDRNKLAIYKAFTNSNSAQNLNNISSPKILYNYYISLLFENRVSTSSDSKGRLEDISNRLMEIAPNDFESNYIQYLHNKGSENGLSFLKKAYFLEPSEIEIWDEMLGYYQIKGDESKARSMAKKIKQSDKYHPDVYRYQRNVIASMESKSVLFVNGEFDTYPLLVTLYTEDIKNDIIVLSQEFLNYDSYKKLMTEKMGTSVKFGETITTKIMDNLENEHLGYKMYLALTMNKNILGSLKRNLYLSGLTFQYSTKSIDNITLCENNFDNKMNLTYLFNKSLKPLEVRDLNRNYIPILNFLENHQTNLSEERKNRIQALKSIIITSLPKR
ncbi:MAG: hypothetical protein ACI8XB_000957 [Patiriisocius sp.]|jgi:hypothetical protein